MTFRMSRSSGARITTWSSTRVSACVALPARLAELADHPQVVARGAHLRNLDLVSRIRHIHPERYGALFRLTTAWWVDPEKRNRYLPGFCSTRTTGTLIVRCSV